MKLATMHLGALQEIVNGEKPNRKEMRTFRFQKGFIITRGDRITGVASANCNTATPRGIRPGQNIKRAPELYGMPAKPEADRYGGTACIYGEPLYGITFSADGDGTIRFIFVTYTETD